MKPKVYVHLRDTLPLQGNEQERATGWWWVVHL